MTAAGVSLLLFVVVSVVSFFRRPSDTLRSGSPSAQSLAAKKSTKIDTSILAGFPEVLVGRWNFLGAASIAGRDTITAFVFPLKYNVSKSDFAQLSSSLDVTPQVAQENDQRLLAGGERGPESALLYLQKKTGSFMYKATEGYLQTSSPATELEPQRMQEFVNKLIDDPTIKLSGNYQKKSIPGVVYYEFHRDWNAIGLPIVSMMGLFNMPEQVKLSHLESAKERRSIAELLKPDQDIMQTTDGTDGRARVNDFNTMTVGVKNGRVVTVVSNLRLVADQAVTSPVIPYAEAVRRLDTNQHAQILTSPSGTGKLDHAAVYPQNKATLRSVTVTDSRLVYLEELPYVVQSQLVPYYLFKGYGVLNSGYRVNVLAAVAAAQNRVLAAATAQPLAQAASQQQGTFGQGEALAPTTTHIPTPQPTQKPAISSKCIVPPSVNDLANVQTDKSGTIYGQLFAGKSSVSFDPEREQGQWYLIPHKVLDVQQLSDLLDAMYAKAGNGEKRQFLRMTQEYERAAGTGCAVRINGA